MSDIDDKTLNAAKAPVGKKRWFRVRFWWLVLMLALLAMGGFVIYVDQSVDNVMHPALDKLSKLQIGDRWSAPEMLKIRDLGVKAVPSLRAVLREQSNPGIRFLLWVKTNWPGATKYYSHFPDPKKMNDRVWVASQALQTLGPAGKSAAPDLIEILKREDMRGLNAATMALYAIGLDADICARLDVALEKGVSESARSQIVSALGNVKPPSKRTLRDLVAALSDSSPYVQDSAAGSLGQLGVASPEVISALKQVQSSSGNSLVVMQSSVALWELEKDTHLVLPRVFKILQDEMPSWAPLPGGDSGQGVGPSEQVLMMGGELFLEMNLREPDRSTALAILKSCCEKSGRIFIKMLLLPAMIDLGLPKEQCLAVCRNGLDRSEDYYRIQAAQLLTNVGEKYSLDDANLDDLMRDRDVGVRVYAAKAHWLKHHQASAVVAVLTEALDRSKHQSYYYERIQASALTVLGEIGPKAGAAIGSLEKITHDPNPNVAKLGSETLAKIRR